MLCYVIYGWLPWLPWQPKSHHCIVIPGEEEIPLFIAFWGEPKLASKKWIKSQKGLYTDLYSFILGMKAHISPKFREEIETHVQPLKCSICNLFRWINMEREMIFVKDLVKIIHRRALTVLLPDEGCWSRNRRRWWINLVKNDFLTLTSKYHNYFGNIYAYFQPCSE